MKNKENQSLAPMIGLGVLGVGAFLWASKAKASPAKSESDGDDDDDDDDDDDGVDVGPSVEPEPKRRPRPTPKHPPRPSEGGGASRRRPKGGGSSRRPELPDVETPSRRKTMGAPFQPGRSHVQRNVELAVKLRPDPYMGKPRASMNAMTLGDWLANVAYWETYPEAPFLLDGKSSAHRKWRIRWIEISKLVNAEYARAKRGSSDKPSQRERAPREEPQKTEVPSTKSTWRPARKFGDIENEKHNAWFAVESRPKTYSLAQDPKNAAWNGKGKWETWLTNVAYWRSYPDGPENIPSTRDKYAKRWKYIRTRVRKELKAVGVSGEATSGVSGCIGVLAAESDPVVGRRTSKLSTDGHREKRNAAIVVASMPRVYLGETRGHDQDVDEWLSLCVYRGTYLNGPRTPGPDDGAYWDAFERIQGEVRAMLNLRAKLVLEQYGSERVSPTDFLPWGLAMRTASDLRGAGVIVEYLEKAERWLDDAGDDYLQEMLTSDVGGMTVTMSGVLAAVASRLAAGRDPMGWEDSPERIFFVATGIF